MGVATQSIEAFVENVVPTFFGKDGPSDVTKYEQLILELANHPTILNDENATRILTSLRIVPTQDGGWSRPVDTYRRTDALVKVLGEPGALPEVSAMRDGSTRRRSTSPQSAAGLILDADLRSRASSTGRAAIVDYVTTLETTLDTSALPPGSYQLALRRQGDDWRLFPAQLR